MSDVLEQICAEEEHHIDWLEAQLHLVDEELGRAIVLEMNGRGRRTVHGRPSMWRRLSIGPPRQVRAVRRLVQRYWRGNSDYVSLCLFGRGNAFST